MSLVLSTFIYVAVNLHYSLVVYVTHNLVVSSTSVAKYETSLVRDPLHYTSSWNEIISRRLKHC